MRFSDMVALPGSSPVRCDAASRGRPDPDLPLAVTVHLRARPDSAGLGWVNRQATMPPSRRTVLTREQLGEWHGAAAADVDAVRVFAVSRGLRVVAEHPARRRVLLAGTVASLQRAFETALVLHDRDDALHVGREAPLYLPAELAPVVRAALGLDACLQLRGGGELLPPLAETGAVAVAMLSLGDVAPGECGVVDALVDCVHDAEQRPLVVLLAFGAPEVEWSAQAMLVFEQTLLAAAAMGVTVVTASPGGPAWFPATAPHALACGDAAADDECSSVFPEPSWQTGTSRRVPDVRLATGGPPAAAIAVAAAAQRIGYPLGCLNAALWRSGAGGTVLPDAAALADTLVATLEGVNEATPVQTR